MLYSSPPFPPASAPSCSTTTASSSASSSPRLYTTDTGTWVSAVISSSSFLLLELSIMNPDPCIEYQEFLIRILLLEPWHEIFGLEVILSKKPYKVKDLGDSKRKYF